MWYSVVLSEVSSPKFGILLYSMIIYMWRRRDCASFLRRPSTSDDGLSELAFTSGPRPYYSHLIHFATGDAVLFSAHFDSAATAPGATDDGMSVAALLQMLTHLAENQPRRTAVFNINNGEENGLSGAHVYATPPSYRCIPPKYLGFRHTDSWNTHGPSSHPPS